MGCIVQSGSFTYFNDHYWHFIQSEWTLQIQSIVVEVAAANANVLQRLQTCWMAFIVANWTFTGCSKTGLRHHTNFCIIHYTQWFNVWCSQFFRMMVDGGLLNWATLLNYKIIWSFSGSLLGNCAYHNKTNYLTDCVCVCVCGSDIRENVQKSRLPIADPKTGYKWIWTASEWKKKWNCWTNNRKIIQ